MDNIKNLKAIDVHSHCTPFARYCPPYLSGATLITEEELMEIQDLLGIEFGVLLPLSAPEGLTTVRSSEEAKFLVDKYPDRFFWFCNVDPRAHQNAPGSDLVYLLEHYKKLGAKGVGEVTANLYVDDPKMEHFFDACEACDMPILFHLASKPNEDYGIYDDMGLPRIEKVLKNHPGLKVIGHSQVFWAEISGDLTLAQRGGYPTGPVAEGGTIPRLLRQYPNLYCDLSAGSGSNAMMRDREHAARFFEEFSDRIMYGCDITHTGCQFAFEFREFLDKMLDDGKLSPENYKKILRENAIRILKLDL
ncbi:MAG: amidohydrolase family protein [Oscillospiraceae bacterium]|nr:amidohydrolase family protein [Oscillospiraceae bacterium]